jgi:hypothetical protein
MNDNRNDSQFRKALNKAFPDAPSASPAEFSRILNAIDTRQKAPAWISWAGSPASALSAAVLLVFVITAGPNMNWNWVDEDEPITWLTSDQYTSLGEIFDPSSE